jgi:hypothetical protein
MDVLAVAASDAIELKAESPQQPFEIPKADAARR